MRKRLAAMLAVCAVGAGAGAGVATAQPNNTEQNGLVNVAVVDLIDGDVLSNNEVAIGVAANVAANVCGVNAQVGVIAQQLARGQNARCENDTGDTGVEITQ